MPDASCRRFANAVRTSPWSSSSVGAEPPVSAGPSWFLTAPILAIRATRSCCAPSWMSRSIWRRADASAATIRDRDAASSAAWALISRRLDAKVCGEPGVVDGQRSLSSERLEAFGVRGVGSSPDARTALDLSQVLTGVDELGAHRWGSPPPRSPWVIDSAPTRLMVVQRSPSPSQAAFASAADSSR